MLRPMMTDMRRTKAVMNVVYKLIKQTRPRTSPPICRRRRTNSTRSSVSLSLDAGVTSRGGEQGCSAWPCSPPQPDHGTCLCCPERFGGTANIATERFDQSSRLCRERIGPSNSRYDVTPAKHALSRAEGNLFAATRPFAGRIASSQRTSRDQPAQGDNNTSSSQENEFRRWLGRE